METDSGDQIDFAAVNRTRDLVVCTVIGMAILLFIMIRLHFYFFVYSSTDLVSFSNIGRYFASIVDIFTDTLFAITLYFENEMSLSLLSLTFIVIPYLVSCIICIYYINAWKDSVQLTSQAQPVGSDSPTPRGVVSPNKRKTISIHWNNSTRLFSYLRKYQFAIIIATLFSGFFASIDLFSSKFFYFDIFYISLKKEEFNESIQLQLLRFINFSVLENFPQLIIQLTFAFNHGDDSSTHTSSFSILFWTMLFTILSFSFGLLKIVTIWQSERLTNSKIDTKVVINGNFTLEHSKFNRYHRFAHKKLANCFETILNADNDPNDDQLWINNENIHYSVEIYWIEDLLLLKQLKIHFEIVLRCMKSIDSKTFQAVNFDYVSNSISQSLESLFTTTNPKNKKFGRIIRNDLKLTLRSKVKFVNVSKIDISTEKYGDIFETPDIVDNIAQSRTSVPKKRHSSRLWNGKLAKQRSKSVGIYSKRSTVKRVQVQLEVPVSIEQVDDRSRSVSAS